jgi:hypothetical protein
VREWLYRWRWTFFGLAVMAAALVAGLLFMLLSYLSHIHA